ncbi:MAG: ABC transporter substrate-binding protein, partial [Pseudomonadota bacterium]
MDIRHMVGMARYNLRMQSIIWSALLALAMFMTVMNSKASADDTVRYERVLAIGGAVTEIVYALGEQDRLIGRDSTSTWPAEATELPDVGYMRALSPEGVLSVKPDLILARENSGPAEAIEVLKGAGVNWVDVPDNFTVQGIDDNIRIIAQALGVEDKGDALRAEVREELDGAAAQIAAVTDPKRAMFILSMRDNRVMASG